MGRGDKKSLSENSWSVSFFSTLEGVSVWHFRVGQDLRICFLLLYYTTRVAVGWRAVEEGGREKRHHKLVSV